jgi:uncharacterized membrane protein
MSSSERKVPVVRVELEDAGASTGKSQGTGSRKGGKTAGKAGKGRMHAMHASMVEGIEEHFPGHGNAILCGLAGLLIALLIFGIGFWRTVFLTILVVVGVALGQQMDGDPRIINALKRLFSSQDPL